MTQSTRFIALALTAGLFASAASAQQELGGFEAAKEVELATVRKNPQAFKNVWIKFTGTYMGLGNVHNPFFTRFTRAEFTNFAIWDDTQQIWKQSEYDRPCSTLFAEKKNGPVLEKLYALQRYQRVTLTGVVRNEWQGDPWIEISVVDPIEEPRITSASLTHMRRAHGFIEGRKWAQAAIELNLASSQTLTAQARGWLHGYLGLCQMRLGRPELALRQLDTAKALIPADEVIDEWLTQARQDPSSAIDTATRVTTIRRGDRPMWEAVEETTKPRDDTKRGGLRKNATPIGATPEGATQGATNGTSPDQLPNNNNNNTDTQGDAQGTSPNASKQAPMPGGTSEKNAASKADTSSSK